MSFSYMFKCMYPELVLAPNPKPLDGLGTHYVDADKMAVVRFLVHCKGTATVTQEKIDQLAVKISYHVIEWMPAFAVEYGEQAPVLRGLRFAPAVDREAFSVGGDTHVCCELITNVVFDALDPADASHIGQLIRDKLQPKADALAHDIFGDSADAQLVFGFRRHTDDRFGY